MTARRHNLTDWGAIRSRLTTKGPDGKLLPAITGTESDEELRNLVIGCVANCPLKQQHFNCPFRIMSGLTPDSLNQVVSNLKRQDLIFLFEMECETRNATGIGKMEIEKCQCEKEV